MNTRTPITVNLHTKFLEIAKRNRLAPEVLADLWCDTLAVEDPHLIFVTHRPLALLPEDRPA